ncbi:MAG: hypothetical protein WCB04_13065 [Mycobacteriales bacterium]
MTAPELLRVELKRQREDGRPFAVAWPLALAVALDGLDPAFWRSVFMQQRGVWEANYCGTATGAFFAYDREPSQRSRDQLVA